MIGKIAVSAAVFAIDKPYSYRVPEGMELLPGHRVQLPFGRANKMSEGIVLSVEAGDETGLKEVARVLDDAPMLTRRQLQLAAFLRERYFCTYFDAARAMLPAGAWFHTKVTFSLTADRSWSAAAIRKEGARDILKLLESLGGEAQEEALHPAAASDEVFAAALEYLLRKKWIATQQDFRPRIGDKTEQVATLAVPGEQALDFAASRPRSAAMQRSVLELLASVGSGAVKDICYYTGASPATLRRLEALGYVALSQRGVLRCREIRPAHIAGPLTLSPEQQAAFEGLRGQLDRPDPGVALLYGVTGSGKTSVYIRLIQHCLDRGKAALLLVPEIALTPQLLGLLAAWFGQQVAVLHSSLGMGERYDQWKRVKSGDAKVIVGTRSAVFAPSENLGVIILDEEQEHSYKSENSPRYCAREVAMWRGAKEHTLVLLGSATPSVESMYHAKKGDYSLYTLRSRYNGRPLPQVEIVDMREEIRLGNDLTLSDPLRQQLYDNWQSGGQTVLLLNRRGNSRALVCVDCREVPQCPRCSLAMTYHSANNRLMCHYCGFSQPVPRRCPKCGGPLKPLGTGTQKVEQELKTLFPDMTVDRMDADTVSAVNTHEKILEHFQKEHVAVLLGTQMVAKGLNLPRVTLVGVLDADLSLYTGGYRAGETTFNLLTQVVGRAGRGEDPGRAVLQTMAPDHRLIRLAASQDYDGFYDLEIQLRQLQNAPPFGDRLMVTFQGEDETAVVRGAVKFRDSLVQCLAQPEYAAQRVTVLGPAPCPVPKINYHYRHRLTVCGDMDRPMRFLIAWLLQQFGKDKDSRGVSAFADVNGFE